MADSRKRSRLQEHLLHLYLRLNGYFVTGFIVHSPELGRNRAEIDALALRHPYNDEPERMIRPSSYLQPSSKYVELLICEVKSRGQRLRFNESLADHSIVIASVLRWAGLFHESEIEEKVKFLQPLLQSPANNDPQHVDEVRNVRIRPVLCSPERWNKRDNQPWFIPGSEIFSFLYDCFCPSDPRPCCSTRYDFGVWGDIYEPIVRFFKDCTQKNVCTIQNLYNYIGI